MKRLVEIRSYNLKPGSREEFHRLVREVSLPLLDRWGVDVVTYGPSPHDDRSYYLIRAFDGLAHREEMEGALYGSAEWREGPRGRIMALIESYTTVVIEVDRSVVDALRGSAASPHE